MQEKFEAVVKELVQLGHARQVVTLFREAEVFDQSLKETTGLIAHGFSKIDPTRLDRLTAASKDDSWAFDATKLGAIESQRMHSMLAQADENRLSPLLE